MTGSKIGANCAGVPPRQQTADARFDKRQAVEALLHFEHAKEYAISIERSQLDNLIRNAEGEKQRQQRVHELHKEANQLLAGGATGGARTAIKKYSLALQEEQDQQYSEHRTLQILEQLVISWDCGDEHHKWNGMEALNAYKTPRLLQSNSPRFVQLRAM